MDAQQTVTHPLLPNVTTAKSHTEYNGLGKNNSLPNRIALLTEIGYENKDFTYTGPISISSNNVKFLIDGGAHTSMVRPGIIKERVLYYPDIRYKLVGINGPENTIKTLGAIFGFLMINGVRVQQQFQIASEEMHLQYDGILGSDFQRHYGTILDAGNLLMTVTLPPGHELYEEAQRVDFEKNRSSSVVKDVMGKTLIYRNLQANGLNERPANAVSVEGTPYQKRSNHYENEKKAEARMNSFEIIKFESSGDCDQITIPARSVKSFRLNTENDIYCEAKSFRNGVYMQNTIAGGPEPFINIYNENPTGVSISKSDLKIKYERMENFNVYTMNVKNDAMKNKGERIAFIKQKLNTANCEEDEKKIIDQLISEYEDVFYVDGDKFTFAKEAEHKIVLMPGTNPIHTRQYKLPHAHREIIDNKIVEMLENGIIEKSTSAWNSPILLVPKKSEHGKDYRLCVDFKKLNKVTETTTFPMPDLDEELAKMSDCKIFSSLDIYSAFHQIKMREGDRELTAFQTGNRKYQFKRMPFGLKTSPITWQEYIMRILNDHLSNLMAYMDDILAYNKTREEHVQNLRNIFTCLRENGLKLKIEKTRLFCKQITYLGHVISAEGVKPNPGNVSTIKNFPRPKRVEEVQRFIGMANYYRKYVKNFAKIAAPMNNLCKKETKFEWSKHCEEAFERLKEILTSAPVLTFADHSKTFFISVDASFYAVGAYISNEKPPNDRPIEYFSKTLNKAQINYSTTHKELLAIVLAIEHFRQYIWGRHFVIYTDHAALTYLFNQHKPGSRLLRWKILLSEFDFDIIHRSGKGNVVSDCLSRMDHEPNAEVNYFHFVSNPITKSILQITTRSRARENRLIRQRDDERKTPNPGSEYTIFEEPGLNINSDAFDQMIFIVDDINCQSLKQLQLKIKKKFDTVNAAKYELYEVNDNTLIIIIPQINFDIERLQTTFENILEKSELENWNHIAVNLNIARYKTYFEIKSAYRNVFRGSETYTTFFSQKQIEVTNIDEINEILKFYHSSLLGGHRGVERMKNTIKKLYTWPSLTKDVKEYVENCAICEKSKIHKLTHTPLQITSVANAPFEKIYTDFVGEIKPNSHEGHKYVMTISCDLSKYIIAVPVYDCTAQTAARTIVENVCLVFNIPKIMVSDNGPAFVSETFQEMAKLLEIQHVKTAPYHPQSNGSIERYHRTMGQYLRSFIGHQQDDWHRLMPFFMFSYNNTVNTTTGFSPHELIFGFDIEIPRTIGKSRPSYNYDSYKHELQCHLKNAQKRAKEMIEKRKLANKRAYDTKNHKVLQLKRNDLVLLLNDTPRGKADGKFTGPFRVEEVISPAITKIKKGNKSSIVHNDKLIRSKANHGDKTPPILD